MLDSDLLPDSILIAVAVGLTGLFLYWYSVRNLSYWTQKGIPQTETYPFLGSVLDGFKKPFHEMEIERYKKFGLLYGHYEGNQAVLSISDLKLLRNIFVKDFPYFINRRDVHSNDLTEQLMLVHTRNEEWRRIRNIITPTFTTGKIKRMLSIFKECSDTLIKNFKKAEENRKPVDTKKFYGAFVTDVIANTAFSTKIDSHANPDNDFARNASRFFSITPLLYLKGIIFIAFPLLWKFLRLSFFPHDVMAFFNTVILEIIDERKRTGQVRNDFLQLLLDAAKQENTVETQDKEDIASNYGTEDDSEQIVKNVTGKSLSKEELIAQCVIFFFAGYETTASTLAFASYYLALNPDIQDKLRNEIKRTIENNNGELTYEGIQGMKYLDNVISETLRLHPPNIRHERTVSSDYSLGDTGLVLPKGLLITIPICAIQRDPAYFPDPDRFDPHRFLPEVRMSRDPYSYLPFGAGPRNCVGMRFALMEMKVCLAQVIKTFNITTCPQTKVPLEFHIGGGLLQPKEILLCFESSKDFVN